MKDIKDKIRGCLMAGAAGDALGYTVEFMTRNEILYRYGNDGIRSFDIDASGKTLISDDTQMTLFTANGLLMGITRGCMRGMACSPSYYVQYAYLDWYYTQTGLETGSHEHSYTWLKNLPVMAHRRAPGCTCMDACDNLLRCREVVNNSKGCGGIMRVAPMALLAASYESRGNDFFNFKETVEEGSEIARITHKHPLAFLPSAMLTELLFRIVLADTEYVRDNIGSMVSDTIKTLQIIYPGKFEKDKAYLADLTRLALNLATNKKSDNDNIRTLGEGWVGEEAWAIAVYCAVRHIDSVEEALTASVNHDGDSDSTGAVTGNIMGAVYGYGHIRERNIFCPEGKNLEDTLELSDIILALADDLHRGCIISENSKLDTPEEQQWYGRYYMMQPAGIKQ